MRLAARGVLSGRLPYTLAGEFAPVSMPEMQRDVAGVEFKDVSGVPAEEVQVTD